MSTPAAAAGQQPEQLEAQHVHAVYDLIADHFSATRYKPWPVVDSFLREQPLGALGADVGCGNGKYLGVNPDVVMLGSDRSAKLVGICRERGFDAMICDGLMLPYRSSAFDFAISIAVIHHFATPERRQHAIAELLRIVRPGGSVLIFVWALEQESQSRRKFDQQDVFVPWKMPKRIYAAGGAGAEGPAADGTASAAPAERTPDEVYQRYYHMFVAGELDALALATGMCSITASGYDRDNHYVILERRP